MSLYEEALGFLLALMDDAYTVSDLSQLTDGVLLLRLCEFYEGIEVGQFHTEPQDTAECTENLEILCEFLADSGVTVGGLNITKMVDGARSEMEELVWKIILRYLINKNSSDVEEEKKPGELEEELSEMLKEWCNDLLAASSESSLKVSDWRKSFKDGRVAFTLVNMIKPNSAPPQSGPVKRAKVALDVAESIFKVPKVVKASQMTSNKGANPRALMTWVSILRNFTQVEYAVSRFAFNGGVRTDPPDELTFEAEETIEVVERAGDWWRGRIKGRKVGWFPGGYVSMEEDPQELLIAELEEAAVLSDSDSSTGTARSEVSPQLAQARAQIAVLKQQVESLSSQQPSAAATISAHTSKLIELEQSAIKWKHMVAKERKKRDVLQKLLDGERMRKINDRKQLDAMKRAFADWEEKEAERKVKEEKRAAVMQDLISNSEMLPDMMLAATRLEMEIDALELENEDLRAQIERMKFDYEKSQDELLKTERKRAEEILSREIKKTGDTLAQQLQNTINEERRSVAQEKARLRQERADAEAAAKAREQKLKEELKIKKAALKAAKSAKADLTAKVQLLEQAKETADNELIMLKSAIPQMKSKTSKQLASAQRDHQRALSKLEEQLDDVQRQAEQEKDEVIAAHTSARHKLEKKVDSLTRENDKLREQLSKERDKLSQALKEFDLHKVVVRNRDAAGAKYKLQLLKRVKSAENARDEALRKLAIMEEKYAGLDAELDKQRRRTQTAIAKEKEKAAKALARKQQDLEREISRAEHDVEKLRAKAEAERQRREKAEQLERSRRRAEEDLERKERFGLSSKKPTTEELALEYRRRHSRAAVQIYSTDQPDIYIFGTRKIQLMVLDGQLMVRVGGGYITIDEFVAKNAPSEARKMRLAADHDSVTIAPSSSRPDTGRASARKDTGRRKRSSSRRRRRHNTPHAPKPPTS